MTDNSGHEIIEISAIKIKLKKSSFNTFFHEYVC